MNRPQDSIWDRFHGYPDERYGDLELAARKSDAGELTEAAAAELLEEVRARRGRFDGRQSSFGPSGQFAAVLCVLFGSGIWLAWPSRNAEPVLTGMGACLALACAIGVWWLVITRRFRPRWRRTHFVILSEQEHLADCLARRICPDCAYPLNSLPPAIDAIPERGLELGPRACPECGVKWPLVPSEKTW
jgi:hypothetical protein